MSRNFLEGCTGALEEMGCTLQTNESLKARHDGG
jgi:hypothetical protein